MDEYSNWKISEENGIFWAKLNRADKMNAFNQDVAEELNKIINKVMQNMYDSKSDNEKMGASMKAKKIRRVRSTKAIGKIRRNNSRGSLQAKNHGK